MRILIVALALTGCCLDPSPTPAPPPPRVIAPPGKPAEAVALAKTNGWLIAVDYDQGRATVGAKWGSLSFTTRQAVAAEVAAEGMRVKDRVTFTVDLYDAEGRSAGIYSTVLGKLTE